MKPAIRRAQALTSGYATPEGTARYRDRFVARMPGHFRSSYGLWLSSIGLGTYLGEPTAECDARYRGAVRLAAESGINVFDSAVNYRHQRSERSIGESIALLLAEGTVQRDELFVATKGGFLTFDADEPADVPAYFDERFIKPGIMRPEDVTASCHVMSPGYLADQIENSRRNLGLETIDLYYVHNPETQLGEVPREEFYRRLESAFRALEHAVTAGRIRAYGTATWNAYRVPPDSQDAVSIAEVLRAAERAGGKYHHFRAIQLPINLAMTEALTAPTQLAEGRQLPALPLAQARGLMVFGSASLLQGSLTDGLPDGIVSCFPGFQADAQRALQFVRSTPGVTSALVGMSSDEHIRENLTTASVAPLTVEQYRAAFTR